MPVYRIESSGAPARMVDAARVVVLGDEVCFQIAVAGHWCLVDSAALRELRRVQRRGPEGADGRLAWVDERDVNDAAAALSLRAADAPAGSSGGDPRERATPHRPSASTVARPSTGTPPTSHG